MCEWHAIKTDARSLRAGTFIDQGFVHTELPGVLYHRQGVSLHHRPAPVFWGHIESEFRQSLVIEEEALP